MVTESDPLVQEDARESLAKRLATGKGVLPQERHNEVAERRLVEELMERARSGEHFPPSVQIHVQDPTD